MGNRFIPSKLLKMVLFGWPGSGKTTFLASANKDPRTAPLLHLNCSGNPDEALWQDPTLHVWNMPFSSDIDPAFEFLVRGQPERHPFRDMMEITKEVRFKSVALDTMTDLQILKFLELMGVQDKRNKTDLEGNAIPTTVEDYVRNISRTAPIKPALWGDVLSFTLNVGMGLISKLPDVHSFIALQKHTRIDFTGGGQAEVEPWLLGAAADTLPGWVKLVMEFRRLVPTGQAAGKVKFEDGTVVTTDVPYAKVSRDTVDGVTKNQIPQLKIGAGVWLPTVTKLLNIIETNDGAKA